jgi:hypothetical protein
MNRSGDFVNALRTTKEGSAFGPKQDTWQRKKVKIFVAICAGAPPFYSASLIPACLFHTERRC